MGILKYYYEPDLGIAHQIEDVLSLENPYWWNKLPPIYNGNRDRFKFIKENWERILSKEITDSTEKRYTAKTCPAFVKLFQNSVLIKFPCDILLETDEDGDWRWQSKNINSLFKRVSFHDSYQVAGHVKDFITLKFEFDISIGMKDSMCWFNDPFYYQVQPYQVAPGLIKSTGMPLNVIVFFEKKKEKYLFQAGSPCAMLSFSDKIEKLESNEDIRSETRYSMWEKNRRFFYRGSNKKWV